MRMVQVLAIAGFLALAGGALADLPPAFVDVIDKEVEVDGKQLSLDEAWRFSAWAPGEFPSGYSIENDPDLNQLKEILKNDETRLKYFDWKADFVATFDRDLETNEDVGLYGNLPVLPVGWQSFRKMTFESGKPVYLLRELMDGGNLTYGMVLGGLLSFDCGIKALSGASSGAKLTVELRLTDPNDAERFVTLAKRVGKLDLPGAPNWFDACISRYVAWPESASLAYGGDWQAGSLAEVASVDQAGCLDVDTGSEDALVFAARQAKDLDREFSSVSIASEVDCDGFDSDDLPAVSPEWKGGVIVVWADNVAGYYGLAKVGERNEWVKLDGPAVRSDGQPVECRMSFSSVGGTLCVSYTIDGCACTYRSLTHVPVVGSRQIGGVVYQGCGKVRSLFADAEKTRQGTLLILK